MSILPHRSSATARLSEAWVCGRRDPMTAGSLERRDPSSRQMGGGGGEAERERERRGTADYGKGVKNVDKSLVMQGKVKRRG